MSGSTERPAGGTSAMDLRHLGRELKTAVELAVVGLAPQPLVEKLAAIAGLLEAVGGLPADSPPVMALLPKLVVRAAAAQKEWSEWQEKHRGNA